MCTQDIPLGKADSRKQIAQSVGGLLIHLSQIRKQRLPLDFSIALVVKGTVIF